MDDLKLYNRSEKELDSLVQTVRVFSKDRNGVWYRKVCYVSKGERKDCELSWYRVYQMVKLSIRYRKVKVTNL